MKKLFSLLLSVMMFPLYVGAMSFTPINAAEADEQVFTLVCNTKKVNVDTISEENSRILFTATCSDEDITSIELFGEDNTVVAILLDDGDILNSGDGYKGDGEFSGYVDISNYAVDESGIGSYTYYAQYNSMNGDVQKSNSVKIAVYRSFTSEELDIMNQVDSTIQELLDSEEYDQADSETRYTLICNALEHMKDSGLIREYSSDYPTNPMITYIYNVIGNTQGMVSYIDPIPGTDDADTSGIQYEISGDHVIITGYTKELPEDVVIPAFIENLPVTEIGDNAFTSSSIQTVTLEGNVKTLGYSVFGMCTSLREVTLCNTIEKIGDYTFMGDSALEKVTLSSGLAEIPSGTFYYCKSLGEIIIPEGVVNLGEGAFSLSNIQLLTLPASLENIDNLCFASTKIKALIVKNPTCTFGDNVFEYSKTEMTIYGYNNSTAQSYALDNDIKFVTLPDDMIMGDVNADGAFNIADVLQLQKWLLNVPNTTLNNWVAADLYADGKLNVFDLCLMKRMLLQ